MSSIPPNFSHLIIIGSDESLKGDTFGGIVVAAVKATPEERQHLINLGIRDSKLLTDKQIPVLATKIKQSFQHEIISLLPEQYNQKPGNLTLLLNTLHTHAASKLQPGFHIVDEYPGCTIGNHHETKAESTYPEVAAASILAREAALQQLAYLSQKAGFLLPKGSTHVSDALQKLKTKKLPFNQFVKTEFKNVKPFL